jgi:hypothetical protein
VAGAATGGSSTGGSSTGGSSTGGAAATAGASTGGSAGHAGAVGTAGAATTTTGGSSGTSSGGAPTDGDGGVPTGACANPIDATMGKSLGFGTVNAVCYRTTETFNTIGCSNFDGRTIKVNGVLAPCTGMKATFAPAIGGYNYFDVSAGTKDFASFVWYTS